MSCQKPPFTSYARQRLLSSMRDPGERIGPVRGDSPEQFKGQSDDDLQKHRAFDDMVHSNES